MTVPAPTDLTLVADIGGTNTRVALAAGRAVDHATVRRYANAEYPDFYAVLRRFLADTGQDRVDGACAAAAGPVRDGVAEMTNLSWTITDDGVRAATGATRVALLNDLQAQGHALGHIAPDMLRTLIAGPSEPPAPHAAQLVIGVGTGFNAAPVHHAPGGRVVAASECGHVSLPVRTDADLRLALHVERAHGFAGVEDVLSGRGLERLHGWIADQAGQPQDIRAAAIMQAIDADERLARETGRAFIRLLGSVTGDLALTHLPFGGIYLIGGVARAFTDHFARFGFAASFRDKGRFSGFMEGFRVQIIEDDYAALTGCAAHLDAHVRR